MLTVVGSISLPNIGTTFDHFESVFRYVIKSFPDVVSHVVAASGESVVGLEFSFKRSSLSRFS